MLRAAPCALLVLTAAVSFAASIHGDALVGRTGVAGRVRRQPAGVVRVAAGEFTMGASVDDLRRALAVCARDPLARSAGFAQLCTGWQPRGVPGEAPRGLCDPATFADEYGAHTVWLRAFGIDRTEVTVEAYARCVAAGRCRPAPVAPGAARYGGATQPVVGVSWDEAQAFCRAAGARLPTEAEWERAARGRDARPFPWGFQYDPRRANHGALRLSCADPSDGFAGPAPVGSFPDNASPDGVLDMAGNVWEWVEDLWDETASRYPERPTARRVDPHGADHGAGHVIRGGAYNFPAYALRTTFRAHAASGARSFAIGFRCAYDQP